MHLRIRKLTAMPGHVVSVRRRFCNLCTLPWRETRLPVSARLIPAPRRSRSSEAASCTGLARAHRVRLWPR